MSDDRSTFEVTRARLEEIVVQVRRKDVSLEQSLDLLEEAVRLVNQCNDLIDQTSFRSVAADGAEEAAESADDAEAAAAADGDEPEAAADAEAGPAEQDSGVTVIEVVEVDVDGEDGAVMFVAEIEDDERS
jgi:exodeoxyribonuclease VII small subunit